MNSTFVGKIVKNGPQSQDSKRQYFACRITQLLQLHSPLRRLISCALLCRADRQCRRVAHRAHVFPWLTGPSSCRRHRKNTEGFLSVQMGKLILGIDLHFSLDGHRPVSLFGSLVPSPDGPKHSSDKWIQPAPQTLASVHGTGPVVNILSASGWVGTAQGGVERSGAGRRLPKAMLWL